MKIYWRNKDIPELAGLSRMERFKMMQACYWKFGFRYWQCWVALLVFVALIVLEEAVGLALPYILITVGIGSQIYQSIVVDRLRPHFRDYIAEEKRRV